MVLISRIYIEEDENFPNIPFLLWIRTDIPMELFRIMLADDFLRKTTPEVVLLQRMLQPPDPQVNFLKREAQQETGRTTSKPTTQTPT